jgi:hypothetical protein
MKESQQQLNHQGSILGGFTANERRKHTRYMLNKKIMSISEEILAEAVDISGSGISCKCLASAGKLLPKIQTIELLNCELGTSVKGLHSRLVRRDKIPVLPASPSMMFLNFSLEFQGLTQTKRIQLFQFIKDGVKNTAERKKLIQDITWKGDAKGTHISSEGLSL